MYKLSIGAACGLSWPSDRVIVQVLDDSTDPVIKVRASVFFSFFTSFNYSAICPCVSVTHQWRWSGPRSEINCGCLSLTVAAAWWGHTMPA